MIEQLLGHPIYIATKKIQRRKHRKARINKKWQKRYGYYEYNMMPHGEIYVMERSGVIWMTEKTYRELWFRQKAHTE
jgi:hypothetical protein